MIVVLDAGVILKWLLEDPAREPDTEKALALASPTVIRRATSLAIETNHHLFDTLCHAPPRRQIARFAASEILEV